MGKNTYSKEDVWGVVGLIVFLIVVGLFISNEWSQDATIARHNKAIDILIKDVDGMREQVNDTISSLSDKADRKLIEDLKGIISDNKDEAWQDVRRTNEGLNDLDEKLADRIPNWNKK